MAKTSGDGMRVMLETRESREVADELARSARRAGFERRECIGGKHQLGTDPECDACARYKAGAVVRKG